MCKPKIQPLSVSRQIGPDDGIFRIPPYDKAPVPQQPGRINLNLAMPGVHSSWRQLNGRGVKIAVLDSGADINHPALRANIKEVANFTDGAINSDVRDEEGHGTMVAGVIAARSSSIIGIAPESELYIGKVIKQNTGGTVGNLRAGIEWARRKGVDIINISLGASQDVDVIHQEIRAARANPDKDIFVICAAGNDGTSGGLEYPARYDECIAVGAVTRNRNRWELSSTGHELDIVAIGHQVRSTFPRDKDSSGESVRSGTSLAAPFVTGVLGLALAKHKLLGGDTEIRNYRNVLGHLLRTTIDLGPVGPDPEFGFGLIDQERFLAEV